MLIQGFNFTIVICGAGNFPSKDKGSEEEVARSSRPKQEVTGNTDTLVQSDMRTMKRTVSLPEENNLNHNIY